VQDAAVDAAIVLPADMHKLVVISDGIGKNLDLNGIIRIAELA
jgi:hypothetical protein